MRISTLKTTIFLLITLLSLTSLAPAQTRRKLVEQGNKSYQEGVFDDALAKYKGAEEKGALPEIFFNQGNALYKTEGYDRAMELYLKSLDGASDETRAGAFYNMGNSLFKAQQFDKAAAAYINSLKLNPNDLQAKQNLELALKMMQQQQQEQEQDKEDSKDKEEQQQQKQQQDQQDQQNQNEQQEQQQQEQQKQEQEGEQEQQQQNPQPKEGEMSPEDAMKLLNALMNDEKEVQKKVIKNLMAEKKSKAKKW